MLIPSTQSPSLGFFLCPGPSHLGWTHFLNTWHLLKSSSYLVFMWTWGPLLWSVTLSNVGGQLTAGSAVIQLQRLQDHRMEFVSVSSVCWTICHASFASYPDIEALIESDLPLWSSSVFLLHCYLFNKGLLMNNNLQSVFLDCDLWKHFYL